MTEASLTQVTGKEPRLGADGVPGSATGAQHDPHHAKRWFVLAVIGLAQLMIVLDVTIVNIALPDAQKDLGFSNGDRQWIVTAYSLAFGSLLLLFGRVSDLVGRRVMFLVGLVVFAGASALGGASPNFDVLVTARALQGLAGAMLAPAALSLLSTTFTEARERATAFAIFGGIAGAIIGNNSGHHAGEGALIGTAAGAVIGSLAQPQPTVVYTQPAPVVYETQAPVVVEQSCAPAPVYYGYSGYGYWPYFYGPRWGVSFGYGYRGGWGWHGRDGGWRWHDRR